MSTDNQPIDDNQPTGPDPTGADNPMPMRRDSEPEPTPVKKRSIVGHMSRAMAWFTGGVLTLIIVTVIGLSWYTMTDDFQRRVGREIVSVLEDATGGRVELGGVRFSLWHLAIEVDGLVIHGLEGPGEAPYLAADKIVVRQ